MIYYYSVNIFSFESLLTDIEYGGSSFFNMAFFFMLEYETRLTNYRPHGLNFSSVNYPAKGASFKLSDLIFQTI